MSWLQLISLKYTADGQGHAPSIANGLTQNVKNMVTDKEYAKIRSPLESASFMAVLTGNFIWLNVRSPGSPYAIRHRIKALVEYAGKRYMMRFTDQKTGRWFSWCGSIPVLGRIPHALSNSNGTLVLEKFEEVKHVIGEVVSRLVVNIMVDDNVLNAGLVDPAGGHVLIENIFGGLDRGRIVIQVIFPSEFGSVSRCFFIALHSK